ncbi:MAG TPA: hypothetical protein VIJ51_15805 [Solirubrobacteraceae bacterium]
MDQATIDRCIAKVDRADELMEELGSKWLAFLRSNPYPHWVDDGAEPGWKHVSIDFPECAPLWCGVVAGEIAHDLRSALDHIAWREAVEKLGDVKARSHERQIAFPLRATPASFKDAAVLPWVDPNAAALMERHQPYQPWQGVGPNPLGLLHEFNRLDKHHAIHVGVGVGPTMLSLHAFIDWDRAVRLLDFEGRLQTGQALKGRTEVMRLRFAVDSNPEVYVKRTPPLSISFGQFQSPPGGAGILETVECVRQVVADFRDLVP